MLLKLLFVVCCFVTLSCSFPPKEWEQWKQVYKKQYINDKEDLQRYKIWEYNRQYIDDHNSLGESYSLRINEFADLVMF